MIKMLKCTVKAYSYSRETVHNYVQPHYLNLKPVELLIFGAKKRLLALHLLREKL